MTTGGAQKDTDIAVLEQSFGSEWIPLSYIGPGRNDMLFLPKKVLRGGSMRIRYLSQRIRYLSHE